MVLAKWLMTEPSVFILDEPTRGVDVGAKYEIYAIIDRLAAAGGGILFISSEIEELLAMCDRILVMSRGEIVGEFRAPEFDRARILAAAFREQGARHEPPRARLTDFVLRNATLIIFVVVFVCFGLSADNFFGAENILNIVKQASFTGIIAVGMTFVLLTAGIDLSVGSNMYVSAMTVGYFLHAARPARDRSALFAGIVVGLATGAAFGAINAFCIVFLRITPFLATLATMVAGHGLVTAVTESFGIDYPIAFTSLGASSVLGMPVPIIVFALVVVPRISSSPAPPSAGSSMRSATTSRRHERPASTPTASSSASTSSPAFRAALGGIMLIALVGRLNQTFGVGKEFDVITAAVLGGTSLFGGVGTAFGAVIGSVLVQMVQAGMIFVKVNLYLQPIVLAGIIFLAVFFDSLRESRLARLKRRFIRMDGPKQSKGSSGA